MTRFTTFALLSILAFTACKKKAPEPMADSSMNVDVNRTDRAERTDAERTRARDDMNTNFARVRFDLDSDALDMQSKEALTANAAILKEFPGLVVEVQGHADERGTTDYNLALGQRRASAVRSYLVTEGVSGEQLRTVSYGEERPAEMGSNESAWSENRRAEFRIIMPVGGVTGTVPQ